jgi:hypothetical protein
MSEALAPMADTLELLQFVGRHPPQLTPQQASTCQKAALLAIGDHIGSPLPAWLQGFLVRKDHLWDHVSEITSHRMSGKQLQGLYLGMKGQREGARSTVLGAQPTGKTGEEEKVAACVAGVQALMQQEQKQAAHAAGVELLLPARAGTAAVAVSFVDYVDADTLA